MAFDSSSTLQQTDEVAAVAPSSSGGGGGGGGSSTWDQLDGKPFSTVGDGLAVASGDLNLDANHAAGAGLLASSDTVMAVDVAGLAGDGLQEDAGSFAVDQTVARTDRDEVMHGDFSLDDGAGTGPRLRGEQETLVARQQADATSYADVEARDGVLHGDLTVMGDTTTTGDVFETQAETVQVSDSIANLNFGETGSGVSADRGVSGWSIDRGTTNPYAFAFHESDDLFRIGEHWLTLSHDGGTGFDLHEEVVGQSSGASGYVWSESSGTLLIKNWHGAFDAAGGETIEGQSSGATASLTGKTEHDDTQAVATREDTPEPAGIPFWDDGANIFATSQNLYWENGELNVEGDNAGVFVRRSGTASDPFLNLTNGVSSRRWLVQYYEDSRFRVLGPGIEPFTITNAGNTGLGGETDPSEALDVSGRIGRNYTSGIFGSGYIIDPNGSGGSFAEFDNMRIRNEFRTHIFKKDIVRASNGYLLISDTAELAQTFSASGGTSTTIKLDATDGAATFSSGDLLWVKSIDANGSVNGVKLTVTGVANTTSTYHEYNVDVQNGGTVYEGDTAVRVSGGYLMNDASSQYAPFLDVYDGVSTWSDFQSSGKLKARYGNLEGVSHGTMNPSGYGLFSENAYLEGEIVAGAGRIADWILDSEHLVRGFDTDSDGTDEYVVEQGQLKDVHNSSHFGFGLKNMSTGSWMDFRAATGANAHMAIQVSNNTTSTIDEIAIGEDFRGVFSGTGMRVTRNDEHVFYVGEDEAVMAGWQFSSTELQRTGIGSTDVDVILGQAVTDRIGMEVSDSSYEIKVVARNGDGPEISVYDKESSSFLFRLGHTNEIQGSLLVDGTLTASKIAADTITANEIAADTITSNEVAAGAVTTDEITIADALTLQPGGSFFAGQGQTRFAFGDFPLSKKDKGQQNHDGLGAGAFASEGGSDTSQDSQTRTVSLSTTDPWSVVASADYEISLDGNASATSTLEVVATVSGTQVGRNLTSASTGSGRLEVIADLDLSAFSGTVSVDIEVITRSEASTTDDPNFDFASADTGDLGNNSNDPTTNVVSSADFFGPDGTVWRSGGQVQIEINGRGNSFSQTTQAGEIYARNGVTTSSDLREKTGVQQVEDPLEIFRDVRGLTYQMDGQAGAGVAAQDLLGTFDRAVRGSEEEGYGVHYNSLFAPVIEGLRTLDEKTIELEGRVDALEDDRDEIQQEIDRLNNRIDQLKAEL